MCFVKFEKMTDSSDLYNLFFDDKLVKTGLTMDEVRRELRKKGEEKK